MTPKTIKELFHEDSGAVTVESAFALVALITTVMTCCGALVASIAYVRCVDAAREAALNAARGDEAQAMAVASRIAPGGAELNVRHENGLVVAEVHLAFDLLPQFVLSARSVAMQEPEWSG
ncbi:pilus assembly protein TadE [Hoyosella rhizosphaerae]|uniref:Pilus assembly protein TadE n=1 Tax=Hoyosella rhizosphaerae TaxID=1755582 RepID=A0A916UKV4_9ACTN|nr:TadE family type IV pilus minor pilin [Hoyosella rhizosphaerae]MBN4925349.1 pilus assembly protein TadE [Hoyosella rhizosphaerae]GGC75985.1 hypothetical protein GCM10011410_31560 [Hoyosella rhizosphaerae]